MNFNVEEHTILLVRHGSRAYGTNVEGSDEDAKGVCVPPIEYHLGCSKAFEQHEGKVPYDSVVYSLRKFAKLAGDCNPNIIEVLFVDEEDVLYQDPWGRELRDNRRMFLSQRAKHSFSGFAHSQLKRIRTHRAWLLKPPLAAPKREDFGLSAERQVSKSEMGAFLEAEERGWVTTTDSPTAAVEPSVIRLLQKEKAYGAAKREWEQYTTWQKSRNPTRAALEARFGYDTKHAGHFVRLMRMCKELLTTGEVIVKRPDADELRAVRAGAWSYDRFVEEVERVDREFSGLVCSSTLPRAPDWDEIDRLVVRITMGRLGLGTLSK